MSPPFDQPADDFFGPEEVITSPAPWHGAAPCMTFGCRELAPRMGHRCEGCREQRSGRQQEQPATGR